METEYPIRHKEEVTDAIDPKSGKPILDKGEYYILPGFPMFYARKEYRGRNMLLAEYVEIATKTLAGDAALIRGFKSKKGNNYDLKIRISDNGENYECTFPPLNPLPIKCPKSGEPVDDRGTYFAFPGYPNLFCSKELFGRRMSAEDYVSILTEPGQRVRFGEFLSKKGNPYSASLYYSKEDNKIKLEFDNKNNSVGTNKRANKQNHKSDYEYDAEE